MSTTGTESYDLIIIGAGGVGSAAMYAAAQRGLRVLAIDRFAPPHTRGSSHGQTRIIRKAYFEHPHYVPLLETAYQLWDTLQQEAGEPLLWQTGLLQIASLDGQVRQGILASATQHRLPVDELSAVEVEQAFPGFVVPADCIGLFEKTAGYLRVERCIEAHLSLATRLGAKLLTDTTVTLWRAERNGVSVTTSNGTTYHGGKLIITAGPWASSLLQEVDIELVVLRKPQFWFKPMSDLYQAGRGCPAFLFEYGREIFYGFPQIDSLGVKVAEHSGGRQVADPAQTDLAAEPEELAAVESFISRSLPQLTRQRSLTQICHYTMSPDEHFLLDLHPGCQHVAFAAGLSGHGYKFAPVLGEALIDLLISGVPAVPIAFLGLQRFTDVTE